MVRSDFLIMALLCEGSSQAVARGEVCLKHDMSLQTRGIKLLPRSKATDAGRIKNRILIFSALNGGKRAQTSLLNFWDYREIISPFSFHTISIECVSFPPPPQHATLGPSRRGSRQGCPGCRAAHSGQLAPAPPLPASGHPGRSGSTSAASARRPLRLVGVAVRQVPGPTASLAGEGDPAEHRQAGLQAPHHRVGTSCRSLFHVFLLLVSQHSIVAPSQY